MYFLTSERIGFRHWREDDLDLALGLWGDPEVTRLVDARTPLQPGQVRARLADEIARRRRYGIQYWPIFLRANGEHLGCCGLREKYPAERVLEFGVHLRRAAWGKGLASEAGRAAIAWAFREGGAAQLFAGHHPENHGSRRMLLKLGFRHVGDEFYPPTGLQHPSYLLTPAGARPASHATR